jgi:hypothetical protein
MIGATKAPRESDYLAYYYEGVKEPDYFKVKSMDLSDPKFSIRDLFVTIDSGDIIRIGRDDIADFKAGKTVVQRSAKGYYGVKLVKR